MTVANASRQTFDIASLAENTQATLAGNGWEVPGFWSFEVRGDRTLRVFYDLSRPTPARIPRDDWPTHWHPLTPISVHRQRPSPAHAVEPETIGVTADADWPYVYAPPGYIGRDEAEHRLLRALKTSRCPGVVRSVHLGVKSNYPVHEVIGDAWDYAAPIEPREFEANRRDLGDWYIALGWLVVLWPPSQRPKEWRPGQLSTPQQIVVWRSWGYSWRSIGERCGRTGEWARRTYSRALTKITEAANYGS